MGSNLQRETLLEVVGFEKEAEVEAGGRDEVGTRPVDEVEARGAAAVPSCSSLTLFAVLRVEGGGSSSSLESSRMSTSESEGARFGGLTAGLKKLDITR